MCKLSAKHSDSAASHSCDARVCSCDSAGQVPLALGAGQGEGRRHQPRQQPGKFSVRLLIETNHPLERDTIRAVGAVNPSWLVTTNTGQPGYVLRSDTARREWQGRLSGWRERKPLIVGR